MTQRCLRNACWGIGTSTVCHPHRLLPRTEDNGTRSRQAKEPGDSKCVLSTGSFDVSTYLAANRASSCEDINLLNTRHKESIKRNEAAPTHIETLSKSSHEVRLSLPPVR